MGRKKSNSNSYGAILGFEEKLWQAADKMHRQTEDAQERAMIRLGIAMIRKKQMVQEVMLLFTTIGLILGAALGGAYGAMYGTFIGIFIGGMVGAGAYLRNQLMTVTLIRARRKKGESKPNKPRTITNVLLCTCIGLVVFVGILFFTHQPDYKEFQRRLDAQGGWYELEWHKEFVGVRVKHWERVTPLTFEIWRNAEGVHEIVYYENQELWSRDRGFTKEMPPNTYYRQELVRLADQLRDAFCMGDNP